MAGQPARQQEDGVDTDVVTVSGKARRQPLCGNRDAAQPVLVERHGRTLLAGARLDLDEGENAPAARDEVDFAAGHAHAFSENPPAMQPQPPRRQPLSLSTAPFGKLAAVQRLSSSARA
jgi:hypothetical protein